MAMIECRFFSTRLMLETSIFVYVPTPTMEDANKGEIDIYFKEGTKYPTLYLLHGLSDDHSIWMRRTSIERYAEDKKIAVVMPAADHSFYSNMAHGKPYWDYISEELPQIVRTLFPLSDKREDNFVAGLSMGGYGAFKLALGKTNQYGAAASLSGGLNLAKESTKEPAKDEIPKGMPQLLPIDKVLTNVFGEVDSLKGTTHDLFYLAKVAKESNLELPKLYQCCGTEDFLYEDNVKFRDYARELGLDLTYVEGPGEHVWEYWDTQIRQVLEWLPLKNGNERTVN
jgi:putative tributyrin esterase